MPPVVSVVICAHNPRADYLHRTLDALAAQTMPPAQWELVLVDNASAEPLAPRFDLRWHPHARVVVEPALGLTKARLRGIAETSADLIVFVDDDNVLAPDYLEAAVRIAHEKPFVGAWGGRVEPEFEIAPPPWTAPYLPYLAINAVPADQWSNCTTPAATPPCGAGMCVRRSVAQVWSANLLNDRLRAALGRTGNSLSSSEDIDLAFTACDLGLAAGRFQALRLAHLIPKERLELNYFTRLVQGVARSQVLVRSLRESMPPPQPPSLLDRLRGKWRNFQRTAVERQLLAAENRGRAEGYAQLANLGQSAD